MGNWFLSCFKKGYVIGLSLKKSFKNFLFDKNDLWFILKLYVIFFRNI